MTQAVQALPAARPKTSMQNFQSAGVSCHGATPDVSSDKAWQALYPSLYSQAKRLVYTLGVPCWKGQESDIAWDIVQETLRRVYEYTCKTESREVMPVQSLERLVSVVARNYCKDLRRHDRRLARATTSETTPGSEEFVDSEANFSEIATENAYRAVLFQRLAHEIAAFPKKSSRPTRSPKCSRASVIVRPALISRFAI
jgi:DNA-directed RNA polymerase specialized sigma24 family protein